MNLYEITTEYKQALVELENSDFDQQTIADTLDGLKGNLKAKALNVAAFIANKKAEINAINIAAKKMADRAKSEQFMVDGLIEYLKINIEAAKLGDISNAELVLKIKKNPPKLVIDDQALIDEKYFYEVPARKELNNAIIKQELLADNEIKGAHIEQNTRLEIK